MSDTSGQSRRAVPSQDAVYSEADVAEMRMRWEQADKDRRVESQLATLSGQFTALPEMIRSISREVALQVVNEQRRNAVALVGTSFSIIDKAFLAIMAFCTLFIAAKTAHII